VLVLYGLDVKEAGHDISQSRVLLQHRMSSVDEVKVFLLKRSDLLLEFQLRQVKFEFFENMWLSKNYVELLA
jgi:hypothetical protein